MRAVFACFFLGVVLVTVTPWPAFAQKGAIADQKPVEAVPFDEDITFELGEAWTGDLSGMKERRVVRVLVTYSKTGFFIVNGRARGIEHDIFDRFQRYLNAGKKKNEPRTTVVYIPIAFDQIFEALQQGFGDIAAANITVTRARSRQVAFTDPYIDNVDEILISHESLPDISSWDELAGAEIMVASNTSHHRSLIRINEDLKARGLEELDIVEAAPSLQSADLLEMINAKLIDFTIVDSHVAELWSKVFPGIKLQSEVRARENAQIAWAVRKDSSELQAALNRFIAEDLKGKKNILAIKFRDYFRSVRWAKNPEPISLSNEVRGFVPLFRKHAGTYRLPWLLMMAQSYQESGFDPKAVSPVGAIGLMQVLPDTGRDMGFKDIRPPEPNIHAGIKYMRWIIKHYFDDPALTPSERVYFALAAYNAGPNRISRLRKKAPEQGLDPNRWFGNVELVVLARVGREPVRYVANINKYYLNYRTILALLLEHGKLPVNIVELQELLNANGYDVGKADGIIGRMTREAIRQFEKDQGLPETGEPSREVIRRLRSL